MKRVIVDYAKLTNEILNLLVEKFPDGYDDSDVIRFRNAKNELVEAVEVRTEDTIYLVKISTKLADRIENYDEDDDLDVDVDAIAPVKGMDLDDDISDDDDEDDNHDKPDTDGGDDDDDDDDKADTDYDEEDEDDED
ncbi:DNA primase [Flavobacterium sharifuzzamanii]|uniref:DNA primase n=1 Tax=Flavobacterium sharifuzzamanii TaxID=2211133 RepID=UPI000DAD5672|nr:DNA primase [Flavobacterium sharifuzzamanii]KAF2080930.1 DNA primase [Flavobacterium sharifuzzamanii]